MIIKYSSKNRQVTKRCWASDVIYSFISPKKYTDQIKRNVWEITLWYVARKLYLVYSAKGRGIPMVVAGVIGSIRTETLKLQNLWEKGSCNLRQVNVNLNTQS